MVHTLNLFRAKADTQEDTMKPTYRTVAVEDAVGMVLPHDMTEIIPDMRKGPAFKKGHVVRPEDVERMKSMGKNRIYVLDISEDQMHEDQAALEMAPAFAGDGITYDRSPSEGKITLKAAHSGLFLVKRHELSAINMLGEVMMATLHTDTPVKEGDVVAGLRAIPLVVAKSVVDSAVDIAQKAGGIIEVAKWRIHRAAIVVTGQEVYEGRVKDAFAPIITKKLKKFGIDICYSTIAPDNIEAIRESIQTGIARGAGMVICTGGMSVDPDDITRTAIAEAGAENVVYGSPVLPGAMFLAGYIKDSIPVLGIPACGMYYKTTIFDIILPMVLAGIRVTREKIASLGHGGLCLNCKKCRYPVCPFGKG